MAWVYILQSTKGKFYIRSTINLKKRLKHHQGGFTPSTRRMGKMKLVFSQRYQTIREARLIEVKLKYFKRKDFIERIIKDKIIKLRA